MQRFKLETGDTQKMKVITVQYNPVYRTMMGSASGGILLSYLIPLLKQSLKNRIYGDSRLCKTAKEMQMETGMSKSEVKTARANLNKKIGSITLEIEGLPKMSYYKIDLRAWELELKEGRKLHREVTIKKSKVGLR